MMYDDIKVLLKKRNMRGIILYASLLYNLLLMVLLLYVVCVKTDLFCRFLAKFDVVTYSVADSRHRIEFRCIEGWANTLEKMKIDVDVVFYGNSITFESDFQRFFPQLVICNMGCNRDNLDDLIHRSFLIRSVHPEKIFVLGGINDFMNLTLDDFEKKYEVLVDTIKKQNPQSKVYLESLLPVNPKMEIGARYIGLQEKLKSANDIIRAISMEKKCTYIDIYSVYQFNDSLPQEYTRDGLHLYPKAYSIWSQFISSYIND